MVNIVLLGRMASWTAPELGKRLTCAHSISAIADVRRIDAFAAEVEAAHVLVGWPLTQALLARARNLRLVQASGAGIDGIDPDALPPGVRLCNTFHHETAIAEYVLLAMLTLARRPAEHDQRLRAGRWQGSCIWGETPVLRELAGQTLLLIGLGHIAREVAVRARAFGLRIVGVSRRAVTDPLYDEIVPWPEWRTALPQADWVVPCCPLTAETAGLIDAAVLAQMKPGAYLINMTRGRVLNEQAVYEALRDGRIAGAAIDVWYQYPTDPDETCLPSRFPFQELPSVLMSPHNSGWTLRTIMGRVADIAENINRLAEGRELINVLR